MRFARSRRFDKHFRKLPASARKQALERLRLFATDPFHPSLNNHLLHGDRAGRRSINASGDLRIVYRLAAPDVALLTDIGTHNELYDQ